MANSYTQIVIHAVIVVKFRERMIVEDIRDDFHKYIAGILQSKGVHVYAVGGWLDHVHLLFALPVTETLAQLMSAVKASSTKYMNSRFPAKNAFAWQNGYSAFSCSYAHRANAVEYIKNQQKHHAQVSFKQEYFDWLKSEKFEVDDRYVFTFFDAKP